MSYTGEDIKRLRWEHKWTQQQLASMIGVTAVAVSKWETGQSEPSEANMARLIELFTNGGEPDRVKLLEVEVSRLRVELQDLRALVVRQARDAEEFRQVVTELIATASDRVAGEAQRSEPQAGR